MAEYQVIARKYRPKTFGEVIGQEAIVTTLLNAIKMGRLAHAYLFCGSRGTGKTTLARVFAKALNCANPQDFEPCNQCPSCKEIASGASMDVIEIDGASHRGIDDIREINENVGYATSSGKYKIYIIDEVHMLTKEAFNALLKTLEEPPAKVKFIFATTEPHKVLPTIISRCQRFNLARISTDKIAAKLKSIAQDLGVKTDDGSLRLIASRAEGGLRDAESLFDQILAFHSGEITLESVSAILGVMSKESLFELDAAGKEGRFEKAFEIAHEVYAQGKDLVYFIECLIEHFRNILLVKLSGKDAPLTTFSDNERDRYETSAKLYTQEQCMTILDFLLESQSQIRFAPSGRMALEGTLLRIMRTQHRLPIEFLVKRLMELEQAVGKPSAAPTPSISPSIPTPRVTPSAPVAIAPLAMPAPISPAKPPQKPSVNQSSITEDPIPSAADLGIVERKPKKEFVKPVAKPEPEIKFETKASAPIELGARPTEEVRVADIKDQSRYDTLLQFAAVELEGTIQRQNNQFRGK